MYGIFTYIWLICMVNADMYTIHGVLWDIEVLPGMEVVLFVYHFPTKVRLQTLFLLSNGSLDGWVY